MQIFNALIDTPQPKQTERRSLHDAICNARSIRQLTCTDAHSPFHGTREALSYSANGFCKFVQLRTALSPSQQLLRSQPMTAFGAVKCGQLSKAFLPKPRYALSITVTLPKSHAAFGRDDCIAIQFEVLGKSGFTARPSGTHQSKRAPVFENTPSHSIWSKASI